MPLDMDRESDRADILWIAIVVDTDERDRNTAWLIVSPNSDPKDGHHMCHRTKLTRFRFDRTTDEVIKVICMGGLGTN